ncbi:TPA: GapS1 family protein, partial [Escherichia coli]
MKRLKSVSDAVIQLRLNAVKASIQSVNPNEFITHCLDYNLQKFNNQLEMLQHLPWVVNLCIKWSASALGKKRKFKHIDRPGAVRLLQRAYEELSIIPTGLENIDKGINFFLRNTLYQQGIYQRLDALNTISRQVFLFSSLDDNNRIK